MCLQHASLLYLSDTPTCSNLYLEELPKGYTALTKIGYYQSPSNKSMVDHGNPKFVSEIVELRCTSISPEQVPLYDLEDHNSKDLKLTSFCRPPMDPYQKVGE